MVPRVTRDISEEDVRQVLGQVMHPAINRSLVELGMIKDVTLVHDKVSLTLVLPILGIPTQIKDYLVNSVSRAVAGVGAEVTVSIAQMNQEEREAFLAMEQEAWKGLP